MAPGEPPPTPLFNVSLSLMTLLQSRLLFVFWWFNQQQQKATAMIDWGEERRIERETIITTWFYHFTRERTNVSKGKNAGHNLAKKKNTDKTRPLTLTHFGTRAVLCCCHGRLRQGQVHRKAEQGELWEKHSILSLIKTSFFSSLGE